MNLSGESIIAPSVPSRVQEIKCSLPESCWIKETIGYLRPSFKHLNLLQVLRRFLFGINNVELCPPHTQPLVPIRSSFGPAGTRMPLLCEEALFHHVPSQSESVP